MNLDIWRCFIKNQDRINRKWNYICGAQYIDRIQARIHYILYTLDGKHQGVYTLLLGTDISVFYCHTVCGFIEMWVYRNGFVATTRTSYSMSWRINQSFLVLGMVFFFFFFFFFFFWGGVLFFVLSCCCCANKTKKLYFLYYTCICLKYLSPTSLQIAIEHFWIFILLWHGILIFGGYAAYLYAKQLWKQWAHYWQGRSLLQPIFFRQFGTLLYVRQYEGLTSI